MGSHQTSNLWTSGHRCPSCGKNDWCRQHTEIANYWLCMRQPATGTVPRRSRHGVTYFMHIPAELERIPRLVAPAPWKAAAELLSRVYSGLLVRLPLIAEDRADLARRGIPLGVAERHGIRSWPGDYRILASLASELWREHGEACHGIPGFYVKRGRPMLAGGAGWCMPMWDLAGRVVAIKIRGAGGYYYLSSIRRKGPGAGTHARLAWPGRRPRKGDRAELVRVTEGEAKAIVLAESTGLPTISAPGVGEWRAALPWLKLLGARSVLLCFDQDYRSNSVVARALLAAHRGFHRAGQTVSLETWGEVRHAV